MKNILFIIFAMLCLNSNAINYYVDYENGRNHYSGLTPTNAWQHIPGDLGGSAVSAVTPLNPGDVVIVRNDVKYITKGIRFKWDGDISNPIKYDGRTWGNNQYATISGNYFSITGFATEGTRKHILLDGFYITELGGYADNNPIWDRMSPLITTAPYGVGISLKSNSSYITVQNTWVDKMSIWQNHRLIASGDVMQGVCYDLLDVSNITFINAKASRARIGFSIKAHSSDINNILIKNCELFTNIIWGVDVAPRSNNRKFSNISFINSTWRDYAQLDLGNYVGQGEKPHRDGIFLRNAIYTAAWTNILIDGCVFRVDNPGNSRGSTASIYSSAGPSMVVRNSLFINDPVADGTIKVSYPNTFGTQIVQIYNNTFFTSSRPLNIGTGFKGKELRFQNNIIYRNYNSLAGSAFVIAPSQFGINYKTWLISDHNLYYSIYNPLSLWNVVNINSIYKNFSQFQSDGYDRNSFLINPNFVNTSGVASQLNLKVNSNSKAINTGTNLSRFFNNDIEGKLRPPTGNWTIGAYQYDGIVPIPTPTPTNHILIPPTNVNIKIRD